MRTSGVGVGVMAVVVAAGLSGCSSGSGDQPSAASSSVSSSSSAASSSGTSSSALCTSADEFRSSLAGLGDVQVVQEGTAALDQAWTKVQNAWQQLADDARTTYRPQVDAVQSDADAVRTALASAQATPSAQTLRATATAVGAFLQDAGALADQVGSSC